MAYGLDGNLLNVSGNEGFPDLDKNSHGLIEVETQEKCGLIFVTQKKAISDGALASLPTLISEDQKVFDYSTFVDEANWKIFWKRPWKAIT